MLERRRELNIPHSLLLEDEKALHVGGLGEVQGEKNLNFAESSFPGISLWRSGFGCTQPTTIPPYIDLKKMLLGHSVGTSELSWTLTEKLA